MDKMIYKWELHYLILLRLPLFFLYMVTLVIFLHQAINKHDKLEGHLRSSYLCKGLQFTLSFYASYISKTFFQNGLNYASALPLDHHLWSTRCVWWCLHLQKLSVNVLWFQYFTVFGTFLSVNPDLQPGCEFELWP